MDPVIVYGLLTAILVGFAKSGIPGTGILAVPLIAMAFEGTHSMGALLPLLIAGDLIALLRYRRMAVWSDIRGLFLWVVIGMALGALGLKVINEDLFRPFLGGMVLVLLGLEFVRQGMGWHDVPHHRAFVAFTGILTGFSTTMGNAAGPVMTIFLLARGQQKYAFVGSMAWFFFIVNTSKLPIYVALDMISLESLRYDLMLLPGILVGAALGMFLLPRINQQVFKLVVLILAAVASLRLLVM